jgi:hypothetical protein
MSESTRAGTEAGRAGTGTGTGAAADTGAAGANGREAYSFACLNCGYGWEQAYEIEHHTDAAGRPYVTYLAEGRTVPSPLTRPTCDNCDGHQVRIMGSGRVSDAVAAQWSLGHAERGVHRTKHWPTLHFLRRKPPQPRQPDQAPQPGQPSQPQDTGSRPSWRLSG